MIKSISNFAGFSPVGRPDRPVRWHMKKHNLLKYMSVLMFFSALVRAFFAFTCLNFFASAMNLRLFDAAHILLYRAAIASAILGGVLELIAGFLGALYCEEPLLAHRCIIWGAAALALGIAANVMQIIVGYGASIYVWLSGAVIPAVYIIGAVQLKHSIKA